MSVHASDRSLANAQQYCQNKTQQSGSSFYYSFLFLPEPRRQAITAFYAFCREVDNVVDECSDTNVALVKLTWWRKEVQQMYQGQPTHPVTQALQPHIQPFALEEEWLHLIMDGMEIDLNQNRFATFEALHHYCYLVASVVGWVTASILGHPIHTAASTSVPVLSQPLRDYAYHLGLALQLTNIIRDVGEDAMRDRIYVPQEDLAAYRVTTADILHRRYVDGFQPLMRLQAQRAKDYYQTAWQHLPPEARQSQRAGLMMAKIYRTLLNEIERDGFQVLHQRIALTPIRKLWLATMVWCSMSCGMAISLA
jgi:phytoene synthase